MKIYAFKKFSQFDGKLLYRNMQFNTMYVSFISIQKLNKCITLMPHVLGSCIHYPNHMAIFLANTNKLQCTFFLT